MTPQQRQALRTFNRTERLEALEVLIQEAQHNPLEYKELQESFDRFARPLGDLGSGRCRYCGK